MIPMEPLLFLGSAIVGGVIKIMTLKARQKAATEVATLQALNGKAKIVDDARRYESPGFQITRRIIALTSVFAIIVLPLAASIFYPFYFPFDVEGMTTTFGYTELQGGIWPFTEAKLVTVWKTTQGVLITPFHTSLIAAITGMYFGTKS